MFHFYLYCRICWYFPLWDLMNRKKKLPFRLLSVTLRCWMLCPSRYRGLKSALKYTRLPPSRKLSSCRLDIANFEPSSEPSTMPGRSLIDRRAGNGSCIESTLQEWGSWWNSIDISRLRSIFISDNHYSDVSYNFSAFLQTALFWKSHLEPIFFIQSHTSNFHIVYVLPIHINVKFHPIFNFLLYLVLKVTNEVNFIDWLVRETFC